MLKFQVLDEKAVVTPEELERKMAEQAALLERCKTGEARYADSLGWLKVEEWAGPGCLARA